MYFIGPPYRKTVQLRHRLPDGSSHIDWMLATDAAAARPVVTFRLASPIHRLEPGQNLAAERIGEHRAMYLDYEGPVSGNRGTVSRLAAGQMQRWQPAADAEPAAGAAKAAEGGIAADETDQTGPTAWQLEIQWLAPDMPGRLQTLRLAPPAATAVGSAEIWQVQIIGVSRANMRK